MRIWNFEKNKKLLKSDKERYVLLSKMTNGKAGIP